MRNTALGLIVLAAIGAGCPTRPNPTLEDSGGDADDGPGDATHDGDTTTDGDGLLDADTAPDGDSACRPTERSCEGACVALDDVENCGACGRVCSSEGSCQCTGSPPTCRTGFGEQRCYTACAPGELLCQSGCFLQPDDEHCGSCGNRCSPGMGGCHCDTLDEGVTFECVTSSGSGC
jgi:hypothetical protein